MKVGLESKIGEVLDADRSAAQFFLNMGMHCLGCPSARSETIEQACFAHGVDADELIASINKHMENQ